MLALGFSEAAASNYVENDMAFVRLLLDDKEATEIYINFDQIVSMLRNESATVVRTTGTNDGKPIIHFVRETPQQILRLSREDPLNSIGYPHHLRSMIAQGSVR